MVLHVQTRHPNQSKPLYSIHIGDLLTILRHEKYNADTRYSQWALRENHDYYRSDKGLTLKGVKELIGRRAHLERMRSSIDQAVAYCLKVDTLDPDTTPFERGTKPVNA